MNTKTYLNQISRLDKMIQNKLSEIYRLKTIACSVTVSTDKEAVNVSSDKDKLGSTVTKIVDLEKDTDYHVLSMRYVNQNTFEEIAQATNWSIRKIFTIHGRALQEFERLYGKEYLENVQ